MFRDSHTIVTFGFLLAALIFLEGCKLGYNKTPRRNADSVPPPVCAETPADANLNDNALAVFTTLANFTCGGVTNSNDGYLMGQSLGYGNAMVDDEDENSYQKLITDFDTETSKTPALVAIDYEGNQLYSEAELLEANSELKAHWNKGGFVSVSWTPLNPWVNDSTDIEGNRGSIGDTAFEEGHSLSALLDDTTEASEVWRRKLDAVAIALKDLQDHDESVVVLWRPLPEANSNKYWWGLDALEDEEGNLSAQIYKDLWQDMFDYLTDTKELHNLLWVYTAAPSVDTTNDNGETVIKSGTAVNWAYPGDNYVDVVAGMAENDQLTIKDYIALKDINRPLGLAKYGPEPAGQFSTNGSFDNTTYADRLNGSYSFVSFWISGHNSDNAKQALVSNRNSKELATGRSYIFNAEDNIRDR